MKKNTKRWLIGLCIGLLCLGLLAGYQVTRPDGGGLGAVAVVNGEEIAREEFERQLDQVKAYYEQQGSPFPEGEGLAQFKQQIVDQLVQQTMLIQEADSRGITATEEEIQSQYEDTVKGFPDEEAFEQAVKEQGLSQEDVEGLIADSIKIENLLDLVVKKAEVDAPTEDELRELYDQYSQQQELPPFEEVKDQLEAELLYQRHNEVVQAFIQELKAQSTVEVLLGQKELAPPSDHPTEGTGVGNLAPGFQLQSLDGQSVSLSGLQGKPVLLNFWATRCPPCVSEMPYLQEIYNEWSETELILLAINIGESSAKVKEFMQGHSLSLPVLLDTNQDIAQEYNIRYIPTTFLIGKKGIIQATKVGAFSSKREIEGILAKISP
jgi:thiol-disulfide isomerase/thioredoxin